MYFPLFVGVMCLCMFCYASLNVHSCFAIIFKKKRKNVIIVLQMYCYYKYSVAVPHDTVGWSAVCDCGIS